MHGPFFYIIQIDDFFYSQELSSLYLPAVPTDLSHLQDDIRHLK